MEKDQGKKSNIERKLWGKSESTKIE